jgi:hypothetical protein
VLIAVWYLGLTAAAVGVACRDSGVRRATGALIIGSYLVFLGSLLATAQTAAPGLRLTLGPLLVTAAAWTAGLARRPGGRSRRAGQPLETAPPAGEPPASDTPASGQPAGPTDTSEDSSS